MQLQTQVYKTIHQKGAEKLVKDEYILATYLANTAVLNIQILTEDIMADYRFLLGLVNAFTIDTDEYYPVCYKVNDAKTFKNLVAILFYAC